MALDALIFDVDGTLVDSNEMHIEAFVQAFASHGYKVMPDRVAIEIGKGGDTLVPSILGTAADKKDGDAIRAAEPKEFARLAELRGIAVFPDAEDLLQTVRRRGILTIVATSSGREQLKTIEKYSGLSISSLVDLIITADDAASSKPAPDLLVVAVKKAKLSPAQCGMVGDRIYDVQSAKHAGVTSIGFLCGGNSTEQLMSAGARRVYRDAADLLAHLDEGLHALSPGQGRLTSGIIERLMREALITAGMGMADGEAPIGCVLALGDGTIVARGWNRQNGTQNKTAHAEMVTFANAAGKIAADAKDLLLVSTLEPCVMCTGAAMESGIDTILFGLRSPADAGSARVIPPASPESNMPRIVGDILADESLQLFKEWYIQNSAKPQAAYVKQLLVLHKAI